MISWEIPRESQYRYNMVGTSWHLLLSIVLCLWFSTPSSAIFNSERSFTMFDCRHKFTFLAVFPNRKSIFLFHVGFNMAWTWEDMTLMFSIAVWLVYLPSVNASLKGFMARIFLHDDFMVYYMFIINLSINFNINTVPLSVTLVAGQLPIFACYVQGLLAKDMVVRPLGGPAWGDLIRGTGRAMRRSSHQHIHCDWLLAPRTVQPKRHRQGRLSSVSSSAILEGSLLEALGVLRNLQSSWCISGP